MNRTQRCILLIAKEIDRICRENGIRYSMIGGTMIGAVRHKGFIPWDDDIDFAMLRTDYNRFLEICDKELGNQFFVQSSENEEHYAFAFSKIMLKDTICTEDFSKNVPIRHGIWVDVFPLDCLPDSRIQLRILKGINHALKNMIWVRCGYGENYRKKQIKYNFIKLISSPFSIKTLKKLRDKLIISCNHLTTKELFLSDYPYIRFVRNWFDQIVDYEFENTTFMGISQFNEYLSRQFGNYMQLPPEEKRKSHSVLEIDYGPYRDF